MHFLVLPILSFLLIVIFQIVKSNRFIPFFQGQISRRLGTEMSWITISKPETAMQVSFDWLASREVDCSIFLLFNWFKIDKNKHHKKYTLLWTETSKIYHQVVNIENRSFQAFHVGNFHLGLFLNKRKHLMCANILLLNCSIIEIIFFNELNIFLDTK